MPNPSIALTWIVTLFFVTVVSPPRLMAQGDTRVNGMVLNGGNTVPVESARVRLYVPPIDASPESEVFTDSFGLFTITNTVPGEYRLVIEKAGFIPHETNLVLAAAGTNTLVRLTPIEGKVAFDIFFQAFCLASQARLVAGNIRAEYWSPNDPLSGGPAAVFNLALDAAGAGVLTGMEDGFYKFTATRTGWETLTYIPPPGSGFIVAGDKVRLSKSHFASINLRPVKTTLTVTARGYDTVKDLPAQPLKGMTIHLTGIDLQDDNTELVPTVSAISREDGTYQFKGLAPIRWKVSVQRLGYKPKEVIVAPDPTGHLPNLDVDVELEPTAVRVTAASIYKTSQAVAGSVVKLQGIVGSNTEGINRELAALPDGTNETASAMFENLLPGRYWIHLKQETTIQDLPADSGPLRGPTSFQLSFFPKETYAEAMVAKSIVEVVQLDPVPVVIRGRLMATDQLANVLEERSDPEPNRIWRKMQQSGITFKEHKLINLLAETNNTFVVDTDAAGNYTAIVPPGIFGVQIPTLTTHTGHNIEFGNYAGGSPAVGPWPYPDVWPYATYEAGHHGAGLQFNSGNEYHLNLFVHRNYINICGNINSQTAPFADLVLTMAPDGGNVVSFRYNHLFDTGGRVIADGAQQYSASVMEDNSYLIQNVPPGTYTLRVEHPNYVTPARTITIAPWDPPGVIPSTPPRTAGYYFPGITHLGAEFNLVPDWIEKGNISIRRYDWLAGDPPGYFTSGGGGPAFFRMEGLPNRLFRYRSNIPAPSYTIWRNYEGEWFTASGSGASQYEVYINGPNDNTSMNNAPSDGSAYTLDLHAYSDSDRHLEIPGVTVLFSGGESRSAGGEVPFDKPPTVMGATNATGQWTYAFGTEVKLISADRRLVRVNVFMRRTSRVTVNVRSIVRGETNAVPQAAVILRNRYGNPVRQGIANGEGLAVFDFVTPQALYIEVTRRGYIPQREFFPVTDPANPDLNVTFNLEEVPPPTIDSFTINRYGLFLPGVLLSGNPAGFDPRAAGPTLTATWKAEARGSSYTVALRGLMQPNEQPAPDEVSEVVDRVSEVWLVDRRAFTNAFVNSLTQTDIFDNSPPRPLNYVNFQKWLANITGAEKDGRPWYVVHQFKTRDARVGFNKFEGSLKLWELPSGQFRPMLIAITEGGGVAVKDYETPVDPKTSESESYLHGLNLPKWAANLLEGIGAVANAPRGEVDLMNRFGEGFVKIGSFSPNFEGRIGPDPIDAKPEDNTYVNYKYVLGVDVPLGEATPETGPMNLGPSFLGFKFSGVQAEFETSGRDKKASVAINFGVADAEDVERRGKDYKPVLDEGQTEEDADAEEEKKKRFDVETAYSGKFVLYDKYDSDWLGRNRVKNFGLGLEVQGKVEMSAAFNASPVLDKIPSIGPVLLIANKTGAMRVYALIEADFGGKTYIETETTIPDPSSTTTSGLPKRWGLLGTTLNVESKGFVRIAGGLQISIARGTAEGTALFQLGAPSNYPDADGIFLTFDPLGEGNFLKKIEGAASFVLRLSLNLWVSKVGKQWQWDFGRFVIDRGSEPSFELVPMNITHTTITPGTSAPQRFNGKTTNIMDNFYAAGSYSLSSGTSPMLAFTGVDSSGNMTVMVSRRTASGWAEPVQVASAAGIVSIAVLELPNGDSMLVWSEMSQADLGNPFPSSTIRFATLAAAGGSWSSPATLAQDSAALVELKSVQAGSKVLLVFQAAPEGPQGRRELRSAVWENSAWSAPEILVPLGELLSTDLVGTSSGNALVVAGFEDGQIRASRWNGTAWQNVPNPALDAEKAVSLVSASNTEAVLAWISRSNSLQLSRFSFVSGTWELVGSYIEVLTDKIELAHLTREGQSYFLVAWADGGDTTAIHYTIIDSTGVTRLPITKVTLGSEGVFDRLELQPLAGLRARLLATYSTGTNATVQEFTVGMPATDDCDGDGIPDAQAITLGLVQDCNRNGVPDFCEIRSGAVLDRDQDGIPDSCQAPLLDDCNRNGVSDQFEILMGVGDENGNLILDECEGFLQTKIVPLPTDAPEHYYRAPGLMLRSRTETTIELQYFGVLEQSARLTGGWTPVP